MESSISETIRAKPLTNEREDLIFDKSMKFSSFINVEMFACKGT